jgi:Protein of unknown function, DUF547
VRSQADFGVWDALLKQYVDRQGRVNYLAWKRDQPQTLERWLASIALPSLTLPVRPDEQLAFWINLYNAFTVAAVLERYPIASIRPKILGAPNWLGFLWFFYRPAYQVAGRRYSLSQIEHKILRDQLQEPRVHFAIVCASIGCPLLRNEAYQSDRIQHQLDDDTRRFINNPDKVRFNPETGKLYCSQIFKWYRQDFLRVAPSIPDYIRGYLKTDLPLSATTPITYLYYDWNLNQRISS